VEGAEYLDEALKNKKGVICVGAHLGNFLLLALRLSLKGYPCNMIVKDADNPVVAEIWHNLMRGAGVQWIPARPRIRAVSDSLKWLRNGGILFFYADQHKKDGVYVEFFGRPAGTVEGPALLHLKTGATILCAFIIRLGRKKHKIVITPPIPATKTGNREEDVHQITQAFTKTIEDFIRRYPEQWWWPHKRWKKNR
jgi:KDO2-lipid IV(A) lauroyltransferase